MAPTVHGPPQVCALKGPLFEVFELLRCIWERSWSSYDLKDQGTGREFMQMVYEGQGLAGSAVSSVPVSRAMGNNFGECKSHGVAPPC